MALWVTPGPIDCLGARARLLLVYPSISACHLRLTPLTQCAITRHVVGSAFRARLGIPQCADLHAGGPFVAIGGYFSWRSLRMRSLRALMAANSRCAHIVAAMPHPNPITNIVI